MPPRPKAPPPTEAELVRTAADAIGQRLPPGWRFLTPESFDGRNDAILGLIGPDGSEAVFLVEAKKTVNARDVPVLLTTLRDSRSWTAAPAATETNLLVAARYLSGRTRQMLADAGVSYFDATGNLRVVATRPAVFIEAPGGSADPWRGPEREINTLKGRPAMRVVRALLDIRPPYGVRELSELSGASLGSTYRTVDFLDREALIRRDGRGAVTDVDWPALLTRWSQDYEFQRSNRVTAAFEPRGVRAVIDRLAEAPGGYAITGSLAATRVVSVAEPRLAMLFAKQPQELAEQLGLRSTGPPNVLIAEPFDEVVFERTINEDGLTYAALSQTAADLLTSPGRGPAEADALIAWMKDNEDAWRR